MTFDIQKAQALKASGLSYRKIAEALGCSKSTIANKLKFAATPPANPLTEITYRLPPGGGRIGVPAVQQHAGIVRGGKNFYLPADLAIIGSRENARNMWNTLEIRAPLQARLWAAALQEGHVEPPDKKDKFQAQVASEIQEVIDNIPNLPDLKYNLLKSRFYGCYGVQLKYGWKNSKLKVLKWEPVNGDSILFKQDSDDIAIYTTAGSGPGVQPVSTEPGYIGLAHVVEDDREIHYDERGLPYQNISPFSRERQAFILMTYDPDPSDFLNIRQAAAIKGLGLRSTLYPSWLAMQEVKGNLMDWLERVGTGITMFTFMRQDEASYEAAVKLAESQSNQAVVFVPVDPAMNGGQPIEGVKRIEPSAVGLENMMVVIEELFARPIREMIVGQEATSKPIHTGLGSGLSEAQENTFARIVKFDCLSLACCLTTDLVTVIQEWNHPDADFQCKYVINSDRPDVEQQMAGIKAAWEMGVAIDEAHIREVCGLSKPDPNSVILGKDGVQAPTGDTQAPTGDTQAPTGDTQAPTGDTQAPTGDTTPEGEQAESASDGSLSQTVGGLQAITALQGNYYEGKIPQEACIANVVLLFGFTEEEARSLFPEIPPEKLTTNRSTNPSDEPDDSQADD